MFLVRLIIEFQLHNLFQLMFHLNNHMKSQIEFIEFVPILSHFNCFILLILISSILFLHPPPLQFHRHNLKEFPSFLYKVQRFFLAMMVCFFCLASHNYNMDRAYDDIHHIHCNILHYNHNNNEDVLYHIFRSNY